MEMLLRQTDGENYKEKCFYSLLNIYNFRNIVHFLKRILQVVDNAVFWQNVLLYFENDPLSPSFHTFSIVVT